MYVYPIHVSQYCANHLLLLFQIKEELGNDEEFFKPYAVPADSPLATA